MADIPPDPFDNYPQQVATPAVPHSREAEDSCCGCVLIAGEELYHELSQIITADDFYIHSNKFLWQAFDALSKAGTPIDMLTICNELDNQSHLQDIGGSAYVTALISQVPSTFNAASYAYIVEGHSIRRKVINRANTMVQLAYNASMSADDMLAKVEELSSQRLEVSDNDGTQTSDEASLELMNDVMNNTPTGIPLGFKYFDHYEYGLGGVPRGGATLVVGDSSYGKTSKVLQWAEQVAEAGMTSLYFGYESQNKEMVSRRIFGNTRINYKKMRAGKLEPSDQIILQKEIQDNYQGKFGGRLKFNSRARSLRKIEKAIRKHKPDLVIIDQIRQVTDRQKDNITLSFLENFTDLKRMASEYNCAIVIVHGITAEESSKFLASIKQAGAKNQMPDLNNISWAKDLKFITDVILWLVPDVSNDITSLTNKPTMLDMIVWILKDRSGDRFTPTRWVYDLIAQRWDDVAPPKSAGFMPNVVLTDVAVPAYEPPEPEVQDYMFGDTDDEVQVDDE